MNLVAVARLLGDQRERDQAQIALRQHAAGAHHVAAADAVPAAPAVAAVTMAPAAPGGPALLAAGLKVSHAEHVGSPLLKIYL